MQGARNLDRATLHGAATPCIWVYLPQKDPNTWMLIPDPNIKATATALLRGRGQAGALAYAETQRVECIRRHDPNGEAVWRRVIGAVQAHGAGAVPFDAADGGAVKQSWLARALHARRHA